MNAVEILKRQDQIVTAIAQAIREPWLYAVVNIEIDVVEGDRTENSIALSYTKKRWRLISRDEELPYEHYDWFVSLREQMSEVNDSPWRSCTLVFDKQGHYQFDFSFDPPPRLNGIYDDTTMFTTFDPKTFLKRRGK